MELWVANSTKQNVKFMYRLPERQQAFTTHIPIGSQRRVHSDDLNSAEVAAVIHQLTVTLGAVEASSADRTKTFAGVCYNVGGPVKPVVIERAVAHNADVLEKQGFELRKAASVAIHDKLADAGSDRRDLRETSVEIREDVRRGERPTVDQRFEVHGEGEARAPKRGRPRKG